MRKLTYIAVNVSHKQHLLIMNFLHRQLKQKQSLSMYSAYTSIFRSLESYCLGKTVHYAAKDIIYTV